MNSEERQKKKKYHPVSWSWCSELEILGQIGHMKKREEDTGMSEKV